MYAFKKWQIITAFSLYCSLSLNFSNAQNLENRDLNESSSQIDNLNESRHYRTFNYPDMVSGGETLLTGIRGVAGSCNQVYISGFYNAPNNASVTSFIYKGPVNGSGNWYNLNFPSSPGNTVTLTNLYGPNNGKNSKIQVVGNYVAAETGSTLLGCLYRGPLNGSGTWTTLVPTAKNPVLNTIAHSTMGGLVVGNYETQPDVRKAFIYDIKLNTYYKIKKQNAQDVTAYGIWHNGGNSYTICGGYSNMNITSGIDTGYLVDWNNKTKKLSNWRSFNYNNNPVEAIVTHFDGITSDGNGGYNLTGDWLGVGNSTELGFFCHVNKQNQAKWVPISYPGQLVTSGNSVYEKTVIGVYTSPGDNSVNGYISTVKN